MLIYIFMKFLEIFQRAEYWVNVNKMIFEPNLSFSCYAT